MRIYIALLRGINVGGNNIVKMTELVACFEKLGFVGVVTYIQSGNVVFQSEERRAEQLVVLIEKQLIQNFGREIPVVVISLQELREAVEEAPRGFGKKPEEYRYDVIFLKPALSADDVIEKVPVNPDVDQVWSGKRVVYYSRLIALSTKSRMSKIVSMPMYKNMTIRNWKTTISLLALAESKM